MTRRPRPTYGFTLVELITTIVLLGIVAAFAAPRFPDNRAFRERGYTDELASSVRYAQRVALMSGCNVRFRITAAGYSAFQRNSFATCRTASAWTLPVVRSDGSALAGAAPQGVVATPATLQFTNRGRLTVNNPVAVTVGTFTLTVNPDSGIVTVP